MMPLSAQPPIKPSRLLRRYFVALLREYGPQEWWPARTRLEVILGAILTQNTSWNNAALAVKGLRRSGLLALDKLIGSTEDEIRAAIRSAGFFRQKARTIRSFLDWLQANCEGSLARMFQLPSGDLRLQLLDIKGLGPETVDAILLYAGNLPYFVADAYSRRVLARHALLDEGADYAAAQKFLHAHLPPEAALFNEYHALLVETGKRHCRRSSPICHGCPLESFLPGDSAGSLNFGQPSNHRKDFGETPLPTASLRGEAIPRLERA